MLVAELEADLIGTEVEQPRFAVVGVSPAILERATVLVATHPLRAYDAIQLASALAGRGAVPALESFACFDRELRDAAATAGLRLIPARLSHSP